MTDDEMRRRILLLMNGMHFEEYNALAGKKRITAGLKKTLKSADFPPTLSFKGEHHFPGYQYLGPGTKYKTRQSLGIEPINDLDRIAMIHDGQYSRTGSSNAAGLPVMPIGRSAVRGIADLGAGSAMMNAAYNPWSDLGWTDRGYAAGSGAALLVQGVLRLHPVTMLPMALIDSILY